MSFVVFPGSATAPQVPARFGLVVGTNGLHPDQETLGRPGHARKVRAICAEVNTQARATVAWAKRDPTQIEQCPTPGDLAFLSPDGALADTFEKYGGVCYALIAPPAGAAETPWVADALTMLLDVFFGERNVEPLKAYHADCEQKRSRWLARILPAVHAPEIVKLLSQRRFVVLQGPPGTGKTHLANEIAKQFYGDRHRIVQLHPATTYESFVGGLAPVSAAGPAGLQFAPHPGVLMQSALDAARDGRPYLLVLDEINRADLGKVLGEAIYLLEPSDPDRTVELAHDFAGTVGRHLRLPPNLHILGTMNTADRSIALLDVAVRRRFAFVDVWPCLKLSAPAVLQQFEELLLLFIEHARDREFALLPGHSYFMPHGGAPRTRLRSELRPLLQEYLDQGLVASFSDHVQSYVDRLDAITVDE